MKTWRIAAIVCCLLAGSADGAAQTLTFLFRNMKMIEGTPPMLQYEVWLKSSDGTSKAGSVLVYNNYNAMAFGPNVVENSKVTVTQDTANFPTASGYFKNPENDNTTSRFAFSWTHFISGPGVVIPSTGDGMRAFTVCLQIANIAASASVDFDTLTTHQQYMDDETLESRWPNLDISDFMEIALPVTLSSFTASITPSAARVRLEWKTATESNNYGFEVERKTLSQWDGIGFVNGHGSTNAPQSYSFVDNSASGRVSYRLKQIDRDGKFGYSKEVEAIVAAPDAFLLSQNYPNPFNPITMINYQLPMNSLVTLSVADAIGREVATLVNEVKEAGSYTAQFDGSKLSSGIYFYTLRAGNFTATKKLSLMK